MRVIYYLFQLTWGLPQNLAGLAVWAAVRLRNASVAPKIWHGAVVIPWQQRGSMALGMFIFLGTAFRENPEPVLAHEFGHTIQSVILGPAYLLIIGVCSFLWAQLPYFRAMRRQRALSYYSFWPERWANALGRMATGVSGPES